MGSFLQKFHHMGAVLGMWLIVATQSRTAYVFVVPNSFIHSIMYFYYALSTLSIRVPFKWVLTQMQMIQFCVGGVLGGLELYHWQCATLPDRLSLCWNTFYVPSLLVLFMLFYKKTYTKKKKGN